jgi:hypothetical protein
MEHQCVEGEEKEEPMRLTTFHYGNTDVPPAAGVGTDYLS